MSFILDALRKSENARQRHGGPALADVPISRRREGRPWWVWAIAGLLAINLLVLLVVLLRSPDPAPVSQSPPAPMAVAPPPAPVAAPVAAPSAPPPQQAAAVTEPADPGPVMPARSLAEEAASASATSPEPDAAALAARVPDRAPIVRQLNPGTSAPAATGQAAGEENLPTLNELTGDRAVGMPPMHLDIHVYSTNPAERFVFINMRKYTEGATLTEGPVLEKIRTDGVVLNQRGFRFVLPRQ